MLKSAVCTQASMMSEQFKQWQRQFGPTLAKRGLIDGEGNCFMHRKLWEWCFIAQALDERGILRPGRRGLGFAVGKEPLSALFAGKGCKILATDLDSGEAAEKGWISTDQHGASLDAVNEDRLIDHELFRRQVEFQFVDMNAIPDDLLDGAFDFVWSSCSFEHLGSLRHGLQFVLNAMACLKPGGIAVHTTEFNVSSDTDTIDSGPTVLYRRCDLEWLAAQLEREGHSLDLDWTMVLSPLIRPSMCRRTKATLT